MLGQAIAQAFADLFGTSLAEGGAIAGAIFCAALFLTFTILSAAIHGSALPSFGGLLIGAIVSNMMGWWEAWTILAAALLMAVMIVGPFGKGSGNGGV
jgi:hypothetical protein